MSTSCMELLIHCIVHLQLILHHMLTTWKLNKNLKKSPPLFLFLISLGEDTLLLISLFTFHLDQVTGEQEKQCDAAAHC